jgi:hypothetical protein
MESCMVNAEARANNKSCMPAVRVFSAGRAHGGKMDVAAVAQLETYLGPRVSCGYERRKGLRRKKSNPRNPMLKAGSDSAVRLGS